MYLEQNVRHSSAPYALAIEPLAMTYSAHSASKYTITFQLGTSTHITQDLGEMPRLVNVQKGVSSHQRKLGEIFSQASII
jgi:hypothetical protein